MTYEAWRISYQSSEQAALAAYQALQQAQEERDAMAAHVERLRKAMNIASDHHIAFAKRMALGSNQTSMMAVDKADALLVRESYYAPVDTSCLARRDAQQQREGIINACNLVLSMGSTTHRAFLTQGRYAYVSTRALREYAETLTHTDIQAAQPCAPS